MKPPLTTKIVNIASGEEIEVFYNIEEDEGTKEKYRIRIIDSNNGDYGWADVIFMDAKTRQEKRYLAGRHLYPELGVIHINDMGNRSSRRRERTKTGYKHVGYAIHEAVFRFSIEKKCHGLITLEPAWGSTVAHFKAGYRMVDNFLVRLDEKENEEIFKLPKKYVRNKKLEDGLAFVFHDKFEEIMSFASQKKGSDSGDSLDEIIQNVLFERINDQMNRKCKDSSGDLEFPDADSKKMYLPRDKILENIQKFNIEDDEHNWGGRG